tara:strand:- start:3825 stop:3968 length:144 start_codon:yes stop_codon:yes gene_type:complete
MCFPFANTYVVGFYMVALTPNENKKKPQISPRLKKLVKLLFLNVNFV